jgi:hypothetical protein
MWSGAATYLVRSKRLARRHRRDERAMTGVGGAILTVFGT